jgi:hypothetical protein
MTTKFQLSDKRGDAIILVSAEDNDPGVAYQSFRVAAEDAGLDAVVQSFQGATASVIAAPAAAYASAPAAVAAAPLAVPGAPRCNHGPRTRRAGTNQRGPWVGWFCPSPKGTPDQCKPDFE